MIALLTTSRKALVGSIIAFLGPLATLYASNVDITGRLVIGCLLAGAIAGLSVWCAPNTEPYVPYGQHAAAGTQEGAA